MPHPIVLVHGYSDKGKSFRKWCTALEKAGYDATMIHLGNYISLSNEITIKDIAEGFDRALRDHENLRDGQPFDAIVHSTGMLVIREWLAGTIGTLERPDLAKLRQSRLKHLIALAPATFGSPMAHRGRSWLGAMFKGEKQLGPDFLEAGNEVLRGLELASPYTWDLAHHDIFHEPPVYDVSAQTPYPFVFQGLKSYTGLRRLVNEPGTDGTVRWAGAGLDCRKVRINLTVDPTVDETRMEINHWKNAHVPLIFLDGHNHGDILTDPSPTLVEMVTSALRVETAAEYAAVAQQLEQRNAQAITAAGAGRWQQFVVHSRDERGDGIRDYFLELGRIQKGKFERLAAFDMDVHPNQADSSYRCFHVNLDNLPEDGGAGLALRVIASSGTDLVAYHGYSTSAGIMTRKEKNKWDAIIEFSNELNQGDFFVPYTTTLVELLMNREPMPLSGRNKVFWFNG